MKMRPCSLFLILLFSSFASAQEASRISRVTLFPGSATVERVARVNAGATQFQITGLPANFDVRTIRLEADQGIRLGEFTVLDVAKTEAVNPRQADLEARILGLGDQLAVLDTERQSAELVAGYLKRLGEPGERPGFGASPDPRNLTATLEAIRSGSNDAFTRIQRVAVQKRTLEKQQAALERELRKVVGSNRDSRSLNVSLAAERSGEIRVSYQVNGPGWQPTYRATLDSASAEVTLERQALIAQNSGEDWSNVTLRLSTDQPRNAPQGRPPFPWRLTIREPQPVLAQGNARSAPAPAAAPAMAARRADAPLFNVSELQGAFSTEFEVPARISLPSDGRKVTVSLSRQNLPIKLRVQVVPKQDTTAYLVALGERPPGVWPSGEMQLYRDGAYIGVTGWNPQQSDKLELPFGRDDLVRVTVNAGKQMNSSSGFIDQRRERQIASEYVVNNRHRQAIELLLLEPSPVSTNEQIKVESKFTPQPTTLEWESKPGVTAWEKALPAGSTSVFGIDYRVTWPRDAQLIGL